MTMVRVTSDSGTMAGDLSFESRNSLRDASFSSYLDRAEEASALQVAKPGRSLYALSSIPQEHVHLGKKTEDGEIDVFGAEKYFSEGVDEEIPKVVHVPTEKFQDNKDVPLEIGSLKKKIRPVTPSVHSESSWNSRSALLQKHRNQQLRKRNNTRGKSFLASLGCNCYCNDKDSVSVDDRISEGKAKALFENGNKHHLKKSNSSSWLKDDRQFKGLDEARCVMSVKDEISFPAFHSTARNANTLHLQEEQEDRRKSLEVFGSPVLSRVDNSLSTVKDIKMLAWDAIPPREPEIDIPESPNGKYNETGSDASSDLFEIESFSTSINPYLARQASDGLSSCLTPTCYAPSEASIEWSTVTASAADFSVMSDSEELYSTTSRTTLHIKILDGKNTTGKEMSKRRPSILSGCKSHKAVRVAGEAYRISDKACPVAQRATKSSTPVTRFHPDSKLPGYAPTNALHRFEALSLSESQFKRAPHLLYMH